MQIYFFYTMRVLGNCVFNGTKIRHLFNLNKYNEENSPSFNLL